MTKNLFILFIFSVHLGVAQNKDADTGKNNRRAFFSFHLNGIAPNYYGDNFIAKGYDISRGLEIGSTMENFEKYLNFHFDMSFYSGDVTRPELVGFFESTNFFRISGGVGHTINLLDKISILPSFHFGYKEMVHTVRNSELSDIEEKVKDTGAFIALELEASYQALVWLEITLGAKNYFDFLSIDAVGQDAGFFRRPTAIVPMIGFKITTRQKQ